MLSLEFVRANYDYDPLTGVLKRKTRTNKYPIGYELKSNHTRINGQDFIIENLIWFHYYGVWPNSILDHKDRDRTNRRINNLREATNSQNGANRTWTNPNGKGVTLHRDRVTKPWMAQIRIAGRKTNLGRYATKEEAALAYANAAQLHHGDFACLD